MSDKNIENIKDTISKLLALADSPNENEAFVALTKARELMAKHKLRPEEVQRKQNLHIVEKLTSISCTKMTNTWAANLSAVIAEHYCCKAYRSRTHRSKTVTMGFIGFEDDIEVCERVFKYAFDCVEAQCKSIRADNKDEYTAATIRDMCNSYGSGFCSGLKAAYDKQDSEHQEYGLVLIIPQEVSNAAAQMGKPSAYSRIDNSGWRSQFALRGYEDGEKFNPSMRLGEAACSD